MDSARKIAFVLVLVIGLGTGAFFLFKDEIIELSSNDPNINALGNDLKTLQKEIFTSGALRYEGQNSSSRLTLAGVVEQTNKERKAAGLPALVISEKLNNAADLKVSDMFDQQYFEHESPDGKGPSDLAQAAGYEFVIVGENLALGNFADDTALVEGWMNSPGHRENILRSAYSEIGVSVRQGIFEGKKTWLAVQEFGTPASACPTPDKTLSQKIEDDKAELQRQELELSRKKQELDDHEPKRGPEHEALVREYNALVERYNALVRVVKGEVEEYNAKADSYNLCLKGYND